MRKLELRGLLAVTVMVLAVFVGTASASAASFEAGVAGVALRTQVTVPHVFRIEGAETDCYSGFIGETEGLKYSAQKLHPEYSNCQMFGFTEGVSWNTTKCIFNMHAEAVGGSSELDIEGCTSGMVYKVENAFATCEVVVPNQSVPAALSYTNYETARHEDAIKVRFAMSGMTAYVTQSEGFCPLTKGTWEASYGGESDIAAPGTSLRYVP